MNRSDCICRTCNKPLFRPYRRYDKHGKVVEGCVDSDHTPHLRDESLRWATAAKAIQKASGKRWSIEKFYKQCLGIEVIV